MSNNNSTHRDRELLSAYVDGQLSADELRTVESWLAEDSAARQLVDELRGVSDSVQSLPRQTPTSPWKSALAKRLKLIEEQLSGDAVSDATPRTRSRFSARGMLWSAASIAAAVLVMFLVPRHELKNGEIARAPLDKPPAGGEIAGRDANSDRSSEMFATETEESRGRGVEPGELEPEEMSSGRFFARSREGAPLASAPAPMPPEDAQAGGESGGDGGRAGFGALRNGPMSAAEGLAESDSPASGLSMEAAIEAPDEQFLIVWADVPAATLRRKEINQVLVGNNIQLEDRVADWARCAAPVRRQIESRNRVAGEATSAPASERMADESNETTSDDVDRYSYRDKDGDASQLEGETILVEATAEQIAGCLAEMEGDISNYAQVIVEPVDKQSVPLTAERTTAESKSRRLDELAADREMLRRESSFEAQKAPENEAAAPAESITKNEGVDDRSFAEKLAGEKQDDVLRLGRAQRLARPDAWYAYTTPPQQTGEVYQLRTLPQQNPPQLKEGEQENRKQQLVQLGEALNNRSSSGLGAAKSVDGLAPNQPLQVLFVFRCPEYLQPTAGETAKQEEAEATGEELKNAD